MDEANDKLLLYTAVPASMTLDGVAWMKAGMEAVSGKGGGGKGGLAQGQGAGVAHIEACQAAAEAFARMALA